MSAWVVFLFVVGLAALIAGAELLVRGASRLAVALRVSPLVIGLTVVAYGTSAPELAVSVHASLAQQMGISLGNVVGSNLFNLLFILGIAALIAPLAIDRRLLRVDAPILAGISLFVVLVATDGSIGRIEGALLLGGGVLYTAFELRRARRGRLAAPARLEEPGERRCAGILGRGWASAAMVLIGLGLLTLGARWLVDSAVRIAQSLGVSDRILGLTLVAAGTSLPELATTLVAGLRRAPDLAVGNIVGSCIFNILVVLGLAAVAHPEGVSIPPEALRFDIPVMVAAALACLPVFFTGSAMSRWEGALFLSYYGAYVAYLVLHTALHHPVSSFGLAMRGFVIPLTAIALLLAFGRAAFRDTDVPRRR